MAQDNQANEANDNKVGLLPSFIMKGVQWVDWYVPAAAQAFRHFASAVPVIGKGFKESYLSSDIVGATQKMFEAVMRGNKENVDFRDFDTGFEKIRLALQQNPQWLDSGYSRPEFEYSHTFSHELLSKIRRLSQLAGPFPFQVRQEVVKLLETMMDLEPKYGDFINTVLDEVVGKKDKTYDIPLRVKVFPHVVGIDLDFVLKHIVGPSITAREGAVVAEAWNNSHESLANALQEVIGVAAITDKWNQRENGKFAFSYLRAAVCNKLNANTEHVGLEHDVAAFAAVVSNSKVVGRQLENQQALIQDYTVDKAIEDLLQLGFDTKNEKLQSVVCEGIGQIVAARSRAPEKLKIHNELAARFKELFADATRYDDEDFSAVKAAEQLAEARLLLGAMASIIDTSLADAEDKEADECSRDWMGWLLQAKENYEGVQEVAIAGKGWANTNIADITSDESGMKTTIYKNRPTKDDVNGVRDAARKLYDTAIDGVVNVGMKMSIDGPLQPLSQVSKVVDYLADTDGVSRQQSGREESKRAYKVLLSLCAIGSRDEVFANAVLSWYRRRYEWQQDNSRSNGAYRHADYYSLGEDSVVCGDAINKSLLGLMKAQPGACSHFARVICYHSTGMTDLGMSYDDIFGDVQEILFGAYQQADNPRRKGKILSGIKDFFISSARGNVVTPIGGNRLPLSPYMIPLAENYLKLGHENAVVGDGSTAADVVAKDFPAMFKQMQITKFNKGKAEELVKEYAGLTRASFANTNRTKAVVDGLWSFSKSDGTRDVAVAGLIAIGKKTPFVRDSVNNALDNIYGNLLLNGAALKRTIEKYQRWYDRERFKEHQLLKVHGGR